MTKATKTVNLTLTQSDRDLIKKFGYPHPGLEAALDAVPASIDVAKVECDPYDLELLFGDLAKSINDCSDDELQDELNELYERLEAEARG